MVKRLVFAVGLALLGAVINVAVAWGWAAWGVPPHLNPRTWSLSHDEPPFWIMRQFGGPGAAITLVKPELRTNESSYSMVKRVAQSGPDVPDYIRARFTDRPTQSQTWTQYGFDERGWPWRCLRSEHSFTWTNRSSLKLRDVTVKDGIQLWPEQTQRGGWPLQRVRALPLRPMWPAFIANTVLYAVIAGIVLFGYPMMIRSIGAKRSARRAMVALAVAPVLVIAVAWLAAWHGARSYNQGGHRISGENVERQDRWGATRVIFIGGTFLQFDWLPPPPMDSVTPSWCAPWRDKANAEKPLPFVWTTVEGAGWPCAALACSYQSRAVAEPVSIQVTMDQGIALDALPTGFEVDVPYTLRVLPTVPLWRGLALNWFIYAFVLFGIIALPGAVKRCLRRRRGRCVDCGYDLRHEFAAGCPECGWNRPRISAAPDAQHD